MPSTKSSSLACTKLKLRIICSTLSSCLSGSSSSSPAWNPRLRRGLVVSVFLSSSLLTRTKKARRIASQLWCRAIGN
jgi:hypothetical protein